MDIGITIFISLFPLMIRYIFPPLNEKLKKLIDAVKVNSSKGREYSTLRKDLRKLESYLLKYQLVGYLTLLLLVIPILIIISPLWLEYFEIIELSILTKIASLIVIVLYCFFFNKFFLEKISDTKEVINNAKEFIK